MNNPFQNLGRPFSQCVLLALCLIVSLPALAQRPSPPDSAAYEQMRERRSVMFMAYLTEKMDLDVEMGQRFWPVYNEFSEAINAADSAVHSSRRTLAMAGDDGVDVFAEKVDLLFQAEVDFFAARAELVKAVAVAFGPDFAVQILDIRNRFKKDMRDRLGDQMSKPGQRPHERMGPGKNRH